MKRFLLPVFLTFIFILESIFVELMPAGLVNSDRIFVPHFLMIAILFLTIYGSAKHGLVYGLVFGLLFDIVYTEILGIYLFMFPLMAYIVAKIMKVLHANILIAAFAALAGVALLELGVYEMNYLIHVTSMDFPSYARIRLWPTMMLNLVFTILFAYPLKIQFEKWAEQWWRE